MALEITKTEGGQGGKRGHSNMSHWMPTEDLKRESNKIRRLADKKTIREAMKSYINS